MKVSRIVIAGLTLMLFRVIAGMAFGSRIFSWVYQLEPVNVWRLTATMLGIKYIAVGLVLSMIYAWVFAFLLKGIPGSHKVMKGLVLGLCIWAVGYLPVMMMIHKTLTVARIVVIFWTIKGFIMIPIAGMIVAAICGDQEAKVKV